MSTNVERVEDSAGTPAVRGFLHRPGGKARCALVLTHGAGSNCNSPILVTLAELFAERGVAMLRCDLPYRQRRPHGPPHGSAAEDQAGLQRAVEVVRKMYPGRVFLGGQSYGGRQATMLAATKHDLADGLLILSYPLHPPGKPEQLRVQHLPKLTTPTLFVSGAKDPFGSPEEIRTAIAQISARVSLLTIDGVGHDLGFGRGASGRLKTAELIANAFDEFFFGSKSD